ncbi:MAG TPA: DHHA1 domain-containing protein [Acidobacteriota bacterium]|nr:DHHA1 domain-containing protein [Acidobacteriota bacterium]
MSITPIPTPGQPYSLISNTRIPLLNSYLNSVPKHEPLAVIYDDDPDGICAAAIFYQTLKKLGLQNIFIFPKAEETKVFTQEFLQRLYDEKVKTIFCLDFDPISWNMFQAPSLEVLPFGLVIIDHHKDMTKVYDKSVSMYNRLFIHPSNVSNCDNPSQYCTSKLTYDICKNVARIDELEWKILPGMIGDMNIIAWSQYIQSQALKHGISIDTSRKDAFFESPFGQFGAIVAFEAAKGAVDLHKAFELLCDATNIQDLLQKSPDSAVVKQEYDKLVNHYQDMGTYDQASNLFVIELKGDFMLAGYLSSIVSYIHDRYQFLLYQDAGDGYYHISVRGQHPKKHLGDLMRQISTGFEGANGGGHAPAAGARCKIADIDRFLATVKQALV